MKQMESVEELRAQGNELFKAGKFDDAVEKYSDALAIAPTRVACILYIKAGAEQPPVVLEPLAGAVFCG